MDTLREVTQADAVNGFPERSDAALRRRMDTLREVTQAEAIQRSYSGQTPSQDLKLSWREIDGKIFHKQENEEEGGTCPKP
ncbi:UNVERIFIED_CONTAM: hypothetical protein FKN15_047665 [Acipenser sinensis]